MVCVSTAETCCSNSRGVVSAVRVAYLEKCGARKWGKEGGKWVRSVRLVPVSWHEKFVRNCEY